MPYHFNNARYDALPNSWGNTSNFYMLPADELLLRGWKPINDTKPPLGEFQFYGSPVITENESSVEYVFPVNTQPQAEIIAAANATIISQMAAVNALILDALGDGDAIKVAEHRATKNALRGQLQ